ncbi:acyltransferase family protein [Cellvibrio sp. OA-2007]|uniref:acyltransferase family protein n=1 Tax=Cellvibrio sp. OA-2007 TaxID=529823 RepID=UPI000A49DEAC|nr:acyltransferase [Cellvibrio sp. OA-2007]
MLLNQVLNPKNNNFDLFRLVAALLVIYGHASAVVPNAVNSDFVWDLLRFEYSGSLAVKFFFILSGLLVTVSFLNVPKMDVFLIKRAARIFPGLFVCLCISVFIVGPWFTTLSLSEYFQQGETWRYLFNNTFLYELVWRLPGVFAESQHGLNGSLWTLPLEVACYLFLAAIYGLGIWRFKWLSNVTLAGVFFVSFFMPQILPPLLANSEEAQLLPGCFALGALFATNQQFIVINRQGVLALGLLLLLLWSTALKIPLFYLWFFYTCLYLGSRKFVVEKLRIPVDPSYGVYIYGFLIQQCLGHLFPEQGILFNRLSAACLAIVAGVLSWLYVEKPMMNFVKAGIVNESLWDFCMLQVKNNVRRVSGVITGNGIVTVIALCGVAWLVHFFALNFVFPGHYSPLAFHHSDFYIPASFAFAPGDGHSFINLLNWPRPLFMWIYKFTGYFGHPGSVAWVVGVVFLNCALTALLAKRLLGLVVDRAFVVFFALYCFLLFTQPYFYTFYTQDIGSQVSYLLLLLGFYSFLLLSERHFYVGTSCVLLFSSCAFLVKETYILSFGFLTFCWFIYYLRTDWKKAIAPGVAIFIAGVISALINFKTKSVFVNPDAASDTSYHISIAPLSVLKELARYASEGIAPALVLAFLLIIFQVHKVYKNKQLTILACVCVAFAFLAWLPNALLPNHHYEGYSFNGLYVCCLLLFFVLKMVQDKISFRPLLIALLVLAVLSPLTSMKRYQGTRNTWVLAMESVQKNMLNGFSKAAAQLIGKPQPVNVLVSGIASPFHPFAFPSSIRSFRGGENANYYFIPPKEFAANLGNKIDLVQFITAEEQGNYHFDQEWKFDDQGNLVEIRELK